MSLPRRAANAQAKRGPAEAGTRSGSSPRCIGEDVRLPRPHASQKMVSTALSSHVMRATGECKYFLPLRIST